MTSRRGKAMARVGLRLGLVISSLLSAAAAQDSPWSLDGGSAAERWRGTGTGSVASADEGGPLSGVGFLALRVAVPGRSLRGFTLLSGQDLREHGTGLSSGEAGTLFEQVVVHRRLHLDGDGHWVFIDCFTNIGMRPAALHVVWGAKLRSVQRARLSGFDGVDVFDGQAGRVTIVHWRPGARLRSTRVSPQALPQLQAYPSRDRSFVGYRYDIALQPGQTRQVIVTVGTGSPGSREGPEGMSAAAAKVVNRPAASHRNDDWVALDRATIASLRSLVVQGRLTVSEIARLYRLRVLHLDRGEHGARAFVSLDDTLPAQAQVLDRTWRLQGVAPPLLGSVVAVKDNIEVAGLPLSLGLRDPNPALPLATAPVVDRLRAQGALVIGKTRLDELAYSVFGLDAEGVSTRNPFAPMRSIGGSSAGSAAAVAQQMATFALGTDTCDSILMPSAQAGLVGLRPRHGQLPMEGIAPGIVETDVVGPITTNAADSRLAWQMLAAAGRTPQADAAAGPEHGRRVGWWRGGLLGDEAAPGAQSLALRLRAFPGWQFVPLSPDAALRAAKDKVEAALDDTAALRASRAHLAALPGIGEERAASMLAGGERSLAAPRGPRQWLRDSAAPAAEPRSSADALPAAIAGYRAALVAWMDRHGLVAIVLPTVLDRPSLLGVTQAPASSCELSAWTGLPAITVPVGTLAKTAEPAGALIVSRERDMRQMFDLADLLALERAPRHRP
jgi:Asp-tRNA(Asn)/Glu-tRNA(Gln) amidotransferase A subunit family amidase